MSFSPFFLSLSLSWSSQVIAELSWTKGSLVVIVAIPRTVVWEGMPTTLSPPSKMMRTLMVEEIRMVLFVMMMVPVMTLYSSSMAVQEVVNQLLLQNLTRTAVNDAVSTLFHFLLFVEASVGGLLIWNRFVLAAGSDREVLHDRPFSQFPWKNQLPKR